MAAQLVRHSAVIGERGAQSSVRDGHAQAEETGITEVGEVLVGKARLDVEFGGARGEPAAESGGLVDELVAPHRGGQLQVIRNSLVPNDRLRCTEWPPVAPRCLIGPTRFPASTSSATTSMPRACRSTPTTSTAPRRPLHGSTRRLPT